MRRPAVSASLTVDVVVALCRDLERHLELQVGDRAGVAVDVDHLAEVGYNLVWVDHVNQRLDGGELLDATHVEPVHIVPPVDLTLLVLKILDRAHEDLSPVREHQAARDLRDTQAGTEQGRACVRARVKGWGSTAGDQG